MVIGGTKGVAMCKEWQTRSGQTHWILLDPNSVILCDTDSLLVADYVREENLLNRADRRGVIEPHREKTGFLPRRKQRRRSASRSPRS